MKCHNCSNQAMFLVDLDNARLPLCLDCDLKFVQSTVLRNDMLERELNFLAQTVDMVTGLPGLTPRFPLRQAVTVKGLTLNNIKVDRSTIGVLNTGIIGTVDAAVTVLKQSGEPNAAEIFSKLTESVANDSELTSDQKNQILELLSVLSTEATAPKAKRRGAAMMPLLGRLSTLASGTAAVAQLWAQYSPTIARLFS
jgi:hypothetical protein